MPEVANAAAILLSPDDTGEIVRAMRDVLLDPELRGRMERLGLQRASQFTWERTAQRTLEIYHEVAGSRIAQTGRRSAAAFRCLAHEAIRSLFCDSAGLVCRTGGPEIGVAPLQRELAERLESR